MKILITGSKGFIGSAAQIFFSREHFVHGCDIVESSEAGYTQINNKETLFNLIKEGSFDAVINAAGSANVGFSFVNPEKDYELNTQHVQSLASTVLECSPKTRIINFSSAAVYGNPKRLPINEVDSPEPLSPYGNHKLQSEKVLRYFSDQFGLKTCSLRVFSAYGPGLKKQLFWDIYTKWKSNPEVVLYGTGNESRDFIFISDVLQSCSCILERSEFKGEVLNVASGAEVKISEAAEIFLSKLGAHSVKFSGEEKAGDPRNWCADISRLKLLGFMPQVDLASGLERTANSYLQGLQ